MKGRAGHPATTEKTMTTTAASRTRADPARVDRRVAPARRRMPELQS
jgi:hypothetical protein